MRTLAVIPRVTSTDGRRFETNSAAADVASEDRQRRVVVASFTRHTRDAARIAQKVERTQDKLQALEERVR